MNEINYPPNAIYEKPRFGRRNPELIILWMLANNDVCLWSNFTELPLDLSSSTVSDYFKDNQEYYDKISRGHYVITPIGKKRFIEISTFGESKKKFNYPPKLIVRRRNYDDIILWMVYNNSSLKWSDFLNEPLSINSSSLSKNMKSLIEKELVEKENKEYKITRLGKLEYSKMLKKYNLDRQSILDEEGKRIEEITKQTINFFNNYNIKNENIQFRFLDNKLKIDYSRVKGMLTDEEDFDKILLFLSLNHPNQYPNYITKENFSRIYNIKKSKLEYYIDEIVDNQIYPIKFFKLILSEDEIYYFQENERIEVILRAITEEHITKFTYLGKLFSKSVDLPSTINNILDDICDKLFNDNLKGSLSEFLKEYINYLAYKIEAKTELMETYDKLEGIIWQDMMELFQSQDSEGLEGQYDDKIRDIDEKIKANPDNFDLYISKVSVLLYYEQLDDILILLDKMLKRFPEEEIDIMMKKASVLRRLREIERGLEIIDYLIEKYPKENDLFNYKAYWLQYLNREEESLKVIKELVEIVPDNGLYQDTYGEILMYFQHYEEARDKFIKVIEMAHDEWFISQTYIKLGICYKELEKFNNALENLAIGLKKLEESSIDFETKQKWIVIANLFITEIEQFN